MTKILLIVCAIAIIALIILCVREARKFDKSIDLKDVDINWPSDWDHNEY